MKKMSLMLIRNKCSTLTLLLLPVIIILLLLGFQSLANTALAFEVPHMETLDGNLIPKCTPGTSSKRLGPGNTLTYGCNTILFAPFTSTIESLMKQIAAENNLVYGVDIQQVPNTAVGPIFNLQSVNVSASISMQRCIVNGCNKVPSPGAPACLPCDLVKDNNTVQEFLLSNPNSTQTVLWFFGSYLNPNELSYSLLYNASITNPPFFQSSKSVEVHRSIQKILLQNAISVNNLSSSPSDFDYSVNYRSYPRPPPRWAGFDVFSSNGAEWLFLIPSYSFLSMLNEIVFEKEAKYRIGMRQMGLFSSTYWAAWGSYAVILSIISTLVLYGAGYATSFNFFHFASPLAVMLLLFSFSLSMLSFAMLLSTFISSAKTAQTIGYSIVLVGFILQFVVSSNSAGIINLLFASDIANASPNSQNNNVPSSDNSDTPSTPLIWLYALRIMLQFYPPLNFTKWFFDISILATPTSTVTGTGFIWDDMFNANYRTFMGYTCLVPAPFYSLIWLLTTSVGYFLLSIYFDGVFGGAQGSAYIHPLFFLGKKIQKAGTISPEEQGSLSTAVSNDKGVVEESILAEKPAPLNVVVRVSHLHVIYKSKTGSLIPIPSWMKNILSRLYVLFVAPLIDLFHRISFNQLSDSDVNPSAPVLAVTDLSLTVRRGEILALLGHNGAGKTTTLSVLTGLQQPFAGYAEVSGFSAGSTQAQQLTGVCPQYDILYAQLSATETLELFAAIKGIPASEWKGEIDRVLNEVKLFQVANQYVGSFSGGMKRRLSVAIAALGSPKVLYLDEPTTGMDPVNRLQVWRLIQRLKRNASIVLTTHNMDEANVLGDRVAIMAHGQLVAIGTPLRLKSTYGSGYQVQMILTSNSEKCAADVITGIRRFVPTATVSVHDAGNLAVVIPFSSLSAMPSVLSWIDSVAVPTNGSVASPKHSLMKQLGLSSMLLSSTNISIHRSMSTESSAGRNPHLEYLIHEYGVSGPTLESVFLSITTGANFDMATVLRRQLSDRSAFSGSKRGKKLAQLALGNVAPEVVEPVFLTSLATGDVIEDGKPLVHSSQSLFTEKHQLVSSSAMIANRSMAKLEEEDNDDMSVPSILDDSVHKASSDKVSRSNPPLIEKQQSDGYLSNTASSETERSEDLSQYLSLKQHDKVPVTMWLQFKALWWKNWFIIRRQRGLFICQIATPVIVLLLLAMLKVIVASTSGSVLNFFIPSVMLPLNMNQNGFPLPPVGSSSEYISKSQAEHFTLSSWAHSISNPIQAPNPPPSPSSLTCLTFFLFSLSPSNKAATTSDLNYMVNLIGSLPQQASGNNSMKIGSGLLGNIKVSECQLKNRSVILTPYFDSRVDLSYALQVDAFTGLPLEQVLLDEELLDDLNLLQPLPSNIAVQQPPCPRLVSPKSIPAIIPPFSPAIERVLCPAYITPDGTVDFHSISVNASSKLSFSYTVQVNDASVDIYHRSSNFSRIGIPFFPALGQYMDILSDGGRLSMMDMLWRSYAELLNVSTSPFTTFPNRVATPMPTYVLAGWQPYFKRIDLLLLVEVLATALYPITLSLQLPMFVSIATLEKEERLLDLQSAMGLSMSAYRVSTYLLNFVSYVIVALIFWLAGYALQFTFFSQTGFSIMLFVLVGWGLSLCSMAMLVSSVLWTRKSAILTGYVVALGFNLVAAIVAVGIYGSTDAGVGLGSGQPLPSWLYIFPNFGIVRFVYLGTFSCIAQVQCYQDFAQTFAVGQEPRDAIFSLYIDAFVIMILAMYLEEVFPKPRGPSKHPLFCLRRRFWSSGTPRMFADLINLTGYFKRITAKPIVKSTVNDDESLQAPLLDTSVDNEENGRLSSELSPSQWINHFFAYIDRWFTLAGISKRWAAEEYRLGEDFDVLRERKKVEKETIPEIKSALQSTGPRSRLSTFENAQLQASIKGLDSISTDVSSSMFAQSSSKKLPDIGLSIGLDSPVSSLPMATPLQSKEAVPNTEVDSGTVFDKYPIIIHHLRKEFYTNSFKSQVQRFLRRLHCCGSRKNRKEHSEAESSIPAAASIAAIPDPTPPPIQADNQPTGLHIRTPTPSHGQNEFDFADSSTSSKAVENISDRSDFSKLHQSSRAVHFDLEQTTLAKVGTRVGVSDLQLRIEQGTCFGLLGTNGAGKTTTISMLTGSLSATAGEAYIGGYDITSEPDLARANIGICPQYDALWPNLTVKEHLLYYGQLRGISPLVLEKHVDAAIMRVGLSSLKDRYATDMSGGQRRRLSLAIALIRDPKIVFADEPSTGLDPASRRRIWQILESSRAGRVIILVSHDMAEVEALCSRIGIMTFGRIRCIGDQQHLKAKYGGGYRLYINYELEDEVDSKEPGSDDPRSRAIDVPKAIQYVKSVLPHARLETHLPGFAAFVLPESVSSDDLPLSTPSGDTPGVDASLRRLQMLLTPQGSIGSSSTTSVPISTVFSIMHSRPADSGILDWSVGQVTLDTVFSRITRKFQGPEENRSTSESSKSS
jgi:ABC-type multidrug transport system ATPase subunit